VSDSPLEVTDAGVTWRIPVDAAPGGVRLDVDWVLAGDPEFVQAGERWTYDLRRPAARRLEYRLILRDADGHGVPGLDPTNPRRIGNPFGDRSVIEFGDYAQPDWVGTAPAGERDVIEIAAGRLGTAIPAQLWTPTGLNRDEPAPLLVAHDGSGLASEADLLGWATWHGAVRQPIRLLLLDPAPGCRDAWYSANDGYSDDEVDTVLASVRARVAVSAAVGLGISLGAVATLSLQRRHPDAYDAVVLQSGSFFTPQTDPQEASYGHFDHVCRAVRAIKATRSERPVPAFVTCGAIEENLLNNNQLAQALTEQDYGVDWKVVGDAHTMTGWRDAWSPELDRLIDQV
jgi:enterochelin esterase family protein